jgi:hypothetical protein
MGKTPHALMPLVARTTPLTLEAPASEATCLRVIADGYYASDVRCVPPGADDQSLHFPLTITDEGRRQLETKRRDVDAAAAQARQARREGRLLSAPASAAVRDKRTGRVVARIRLLKGQLITDTRPQRDGELVTWNCGSAGPRVQPGGGVQVVPFLAEKTTVSTDPDLAVPVPVCATLLGASKLELQWNRGP